MKFTKLHGDYLFIQINCIIAADPPPKNSAAAYSVSKWVDELKAADKSGDPLKLIDNFQNGVKLLWSRLVGLEVMIGALKTQPKESVKMIHQLVEAYEKSKKPK